MQPPPREPAATGCLRRWAPEAGPASDDPDPESLARLQRARRWHALWVLGALALAAVAWLGVRRALRFELADFRETFRAAAPEAHVPDRARGFLLSWLRDEPELCGVAAPNLQLYVSYAVMRWHGLLVEVTQPRYRPAEGARRVAVREESLMCHGNGTAQWRDRWDRVHIAYRRPLPLGGPGDDHLLLRGAEASCWQHFVDVLEGHWPCADVSTHAADALRMPRVPAAWRYYHQA